MLACGYARSEFWNSIWSHSTLLKFYLPKSSLKTLAILKACSSLKALEQRKQLHCLANKHGRLNLNIHVSYANKTRIVPAKMSVRLTKSSTRRGTLSHLVWCSYQQVSNVKPRDVTKLSVLCSCASLGALDLRRWRHEYVTKNGLNNYVKVNTALSNMYAKWGCEDVIL